MDSGAVLTASGMAVAAIYWLVRLEGRIDLNDARYNDLKNDLKEIKDDVKALLVRPVKGHE